MLQKEYQRTMLQRKYQTNSAAKIIPNEYAIFTPSEALKALQAPECSELFDPVRASCWISAQHALHTRGYAKHTHILHYMTYIT